MRIIDLNCDMGEGFGHYKVGCDAEIIQQISSANIACGFHGGDPLVMKETIQLALQRGVGIGAHPGFFDLLGFGRRPIPVESSRLKQEILYQLGALSGIAKGLGAELQHVKAHGALNNLAAVDRELALVLCEAIASYDERLPIIALASSCMEQAGEEMGLPVAREAYADRAYHADGRLVLRHIPGACLEDVSLVVHRVLGMVQQNRVVSIEGEEIPMEADTICIHGDTPGALSLAIAVNRALQERGIQIAPLAAVLADRGLV